jgi:predicted nucleic acid-binding protein
MSAAGEVCVDASLAVKVVVAEPDSDKADALFAHFANEGTRLIAPVFFAVETDSILRQKLVVRKELTPEQAEASFAKLVSLPIQLISAPTQRQRAWELASKFNFATVYDATYLALAELMGCEFWTADHRLFAGVRDSLRFVRYLDEFISAETP